MKKLKKIFKDNGIGVINSTYDSIYLETYEYITHSDEEEWYKHTLLNYGNDYIEICIDDILNCIERYKKLVSYVDIISAYIPDYDVSYCGYIIDNFITLKIKKDNKIFFDFSITEFDMLENSYDELVVGMEYITSEFFKEWFIEMIHLNWEETVISNKATQHFYKLPLKEQIKMDEKISKICKK